MECPKCKAPHPDDASFCSLCFERFVGPEQAATERPSPGAPDGSVARGADGWKTALKWIAFAALIGALFLLRWERNLKSLPKLERPQKPTFTPSKPAPGVVFLPATGLQQLCLPLPSPPKGIKEAYINGVPATMNAKGEWCVDAVVEPGWQNVQTKVVENK